MANKKHNELTGDELHFPKGFAEAANETALVKDANGDLDYRPLSQLGEQGPIGPQGPDSAAITNVVIVQKIPGPNQFSDPIAAMASIVGASMANPFVLEIGPGIYQLSAPLVLKEGVTVKAKGHGTVILEPSNVNNDLVQIPVNNCRIQGMLLRGATGVGAAAVRISGTATVAVLDFITVQNCTEGIVVTSSTATIQAVLRNIRLISGSTTTSLLKILASGGFASVARVYSAILTDDNGTSLEDAIFVSGPGARIDGNTLLVRSTVGVGDGLRANDGAEIVSQSGAEIEGFNQNVFIENVGANPIFRSTTIMARNAILNDLNVEHPGTMGSAMVKANLNKVVVNDDAPLKLILTTVNPADNTGQFIRGDMLQADKFSHRINLSKLTRGSSTMGLFSGGELSDAGGLNVAVAGGNGFVIDSVEGHVREHTWTPDVVTLLPQTATYIFINNNGMISSGTSLPDTRENIVLGLVATLAGSVHFIQDTPVDLNQLGNFVELFNRNALGAIYETGSLVAEGVTARTLNIGSGKFWFGTTPFLPTGGSPITFSQFFRQAVSGFNVITGVTQVDNANYDTGTGALVALGAGKFAKHALYVTGSGVSTKFLLVTSQAQYDSLIEAEGANIPTPPSTFIDAVVLIATVIVQQGQTNISEIVDTRPVIGFKAPGISATATHANLLGLEVDDHLQYLRTDGGRTMSGNLNMGGNSVTNVGLVDGVDVSNHAARHAPNGADPLALGTPSTVGTTNDPGNSNDFARGNHSHAHGNLGGGATHAAATTSVNGYMSAADKVRVDAIESLADGRITLQKGAANGLTPLGADSKVPSIYLPSFVDDVEEYADLASFPITGETGKIYVALDTNVTYRWSGSIYVEISPSEVKSVNGFTGIISLLTTNIPEGTNLYFTNARARAALSIVAPLAYNSGTGQFSIPAAAGPSTNGYMLGADKQKLDRMATGFLQYNNANQIQTTTTTWVDAILGNDLNSFANGFFTKASTTEFRADFTGRVKIHYSVNGAAAGNNRGFDVRVLKGGTPVPNTTRHGSSSSTTSNGHCGHTQIIEVTNGDLLKLQLESSAAAQTTTYAAGEVSMTVEIYSIGLT